MNATTERAIIHSSRAQNGYRVGFTTAREPISRTVTHGNSPTQEWSPSLRSIEWDMPSTGHDRTRTSNSRRFGWRP
jgi:hypothetical protein